MQLKPNRQIGTILAAITSNMFFQFDWRKYFLFLISLVSLLNVRSQHFEWAGTGNNIDLRYNFATVDADNNLIVAGEAQQSFIHRGDATLFDARGDSVLIDAWREQTLVVSYSAQGKINWSMPISAGNQLLGLSSKPDGTVVMLTKQRRNYDYDENEDGNKPKKHGPWLSLSIIKNGQIAKSISLEFTFTQRADISDFKAAPGGGYLVSGFCNPGIFCSQLENKAGAAGGDFILFFDETGNAKWADVVSYTKTTCCSYFSNMCKLAIAPDGTVYLAGTYHEGATFGGKTTIQSKQNKSGKKDIEGYESYLAAYSQNGAFKWVKTSGEKSLNTAIIADASGVYFTCLAHGGKTYYGKKLDTSEQKTALFFGFDPSGKLLFGKSHRYKSAHSLAMDEAHHIYLLGTLDYFPKLKPMIDADSLESDKNLFIARFSPNGNLDWTKQAKVPVETLNEHLHLRVDHCNNLFVAGTMWFVLPAKMYWWDNAFLHGNGYGPAPFIAKFANTIPPKARLNPIANNLKNQTPLVLNADTVTQVKNTQDTVAQDPHSPENGNYCRISPGPWTLSVNPNPFNSKAEFVFTNTYGDFVSLEIRDLNGKIVHTFFTQRNLDAGKYSVEYITNLSAGSYIGVLKGTETICTARFIIVK